MRDGEGHTVRGTVRDGSERDGEGHTVRGTVMHTVRETVRGTQ